MPANQQPHEERDKPHPLAGRLFCPQCGEVALFLNRLTYCRCKEINAKVYEDDSKSVYVNLSGKGSVYLLPSYARRRIE